MLRKNRLTMAVSAALGMSAAAALPQLANAQQEQLLIEEVIVTGSRITSPGLVSSSPVTSVDAAEIGFRQPATVEDFLKQLPSAVPSIGVGTNNGANGGAEVDLRGLGSNRTLVLVNGRRLTPFNLNGAVDTNAIPVSLIERVDLITGGASAVYGADAISGVINFILRRDFEGVEVNTTYGTSTDSDADQKRVDITLGANTPDGRGNVTLGFGYTDRDLLTQGERAFGVESLSSITGLPEGSSASVPTVTTSLASLGGIGGLGAYDPELGAFRAFEQGDFFNFNPLNLFQAPLERTQFTAMGRYEINRHLEAYAETMFTSSKVDQNLAPSGTFFNNWDISVANPFLTDATRQQLCANSNTPINDCSAGSDETITAVQLRRRITELGPRLGNFDNKMFQYTLGLRGEIVDNWNYDVYWSRGEADQSFLAGNWGSNRSVQQALLANADGCLDPSNGCTPLNLFGPEGSITPDMIDFINLSSLQSQSVVQEVGAIAIDGDLGDIRSPLADQPIGLAFGFEHRRIGAGNLSDQASQIQGEVLGTGAPTPDRSGSYKLNEVFFEILAPLISNAPGIQSLTLEAGVRFSEFDVEDAVTYESWKAGLAWEPVDSVLVRAMAQRATRSPNINELFAPLVTGLSNLDTDPCAGAAINAADANTPGTLANLCLQTGVPLSQMGSLAQPAAGQINVLTGGNPALEPEEADTFTIGVAWQPKFADSLRLTLDYYLIEVNDAVSNPSSTDILQNCYLASSNPNFEFNDDCAAVGRSPITGDLNAGDALGVALPLSNLGTIETAGWDLAAFYDMGLGDMGMLSFAFNLNYVDKWDFQATPTAVNRDCVGFYSVACNDAAGLIYEWKSNLRTTWSYDDYDLSLLWRYQDSVKIEPGAGTFLESFSDISSYSYFDLTGVWQASDQLRISLSVNNLLDKQPPVVGNSIGNTSINSGNTFPQFYDTIGRYYNLGLRVAF